jgi:AcrR family transcriptional regulator
VSLEPRRRRRGQALDDAILEAAWQQLEASGYAGFTIEAVAERAGTSRPVIYRRWSDRDDLVGAAIAHELNRTRIAIPDTGSMRADVLELMRRANESRGRLIPMLSVLVGSYFSATGTSFAELRERAFGHRAGGALDEILDRAVARGEADPARITPRVRTIAFDLFRHDLLMTMKPLTDQDIVDIVDQILLPLVRPVGCPADDEV